MTQSIEKFGVMRHFRSQFQECKTQKHSRNHPRRLKKHLPPRSRHLLNSATPPMQLLLPHATTSTKRYCSWLVEVDDNTSVISQHFPVSDRGRHSPSNFSVSELLHGLVKFRQAHNSRLESQQSYFTFQPPLLTF